MVDKELTTLGDQGFTPASQPRQVLFYMSILRCNGTPTRIISSGDEITFQAPIQLDNWYAALVDIDQRLCDYQEANPGIIVVDVISDEIFEIVGLLMDVEGLKPGPDDDLSDLIFWLSNPVLAKQMGRGVQ